MITIFLKIHHLYILISPNIQKIQIKKERIICFISDICFLAVLKEKGRWKRNVLEYLLLKVHEQLDIYGISLLTYFSRNLMFVKLKSRKLTSLLSIFTKLNLCRVVHPDLPLPLVFLIFQYILLSVSFCPFPHSYMTSVLQWNQRTVLKLCYFSPLPFQALDM